MWEIEAATAMLSLKRKSARDRHDGMPSIPYPRGLKQTIPLWGVEARLAPDPISPMRTRLGKDCGGVRDHTRLYGRREDRAINKKR